MPLICAVGSASALTVGTVTGGCGAVSAAGGDATPGAARAIVPATSTGARAARTARHPRGRVRVGADAITGDLLGAASRRRVTLGGTHGRHWPTLDRTSRRV